MKQCVFMFFTYVRCIIYSCIYDYTHTILDYITLDMLCRPVHNRLCLSLKSTSKDGTEISCAKCWK